MFQIIGRLFEWMIAALSIGVALVLLALVYQAVEGWSPPGLNTSLQYLGFAVVAYLVAALIAVFVHIKKR